MPKKQQINLAIQLKRRAFNVPLYVPAVRLDYQTKPNQWASPASEIIVIIIIIIIGHNRCRDC
jgi:hypothetical protein